MWLVFNPFDRLKIQQFLCFLMMCQSRGYFNFLTLLVIGGLYLNLELLESYFHRFFFSDWVEGNQFLSLQLSLLYPTYFVKPSSLSASRLVSQGLQKLWHMLISKVKEKTFLFASALHCTSCAVTLFPTVLCWTAVLGLTFPTTS